MNSRKIRLLLWCGCLGAVILFAGDMLFYGDWGSARSWSHDYFLSMMAHVAPWRHHLGSITGPVGDTGFEPVTSTVCRKLRRKGKPRK